MSVNVREFIDFWVANSVHAAEQFGAAGAEQVASVLASRCVAAAKTQGLTKDDLEKEIGDLAFYLQAKLTSANELEQERRKHPRG